MRAPDVARRGGAAGDRPPGHRDLPRVPPIDLAPAWTLTFDQVDDVLLRVEESLLTVADGRVGTRGSLEEQGPDCDPLVIAAGVFTAGGAGPVERTPTLLHGPDWTHLLLDPRLRADTTRSLDLRTGCTLRTSTDPAGGPPLRSLRFACLARPGIAVLWAEGPLDAVDTAGPLQLPASDGAGARVELAADRRSAATWSPVGRIEVTATEDVDDVGDRRVVRRVAIAVRGVASPDGGAIELEPAPSAAPVEVLLEEQRAAWARRWERADVRIEGDPELQLAVRTGLFHVMSAVADTGEAAVGPRGLTGRTYRGHVFWDADVFVLPFLAATHPAASAAMIAYRTARLGAARAAASAAGRLGARFPWESAHDGADVTPTSAIGFDGTPVDILTGRYQEHVTASVAWGVAHHLDWTGDQRLARGAARELLLDTARYWASRATWGRDGRAHLLEVMGPDEYHAPVDDDAFTNGMARWNLRRAAGAVPADAPAGERREAAAWRHVADHLVDGYDPHTGTHEQFAGFDRLADAPPDLPLRAPVAADVWLGADRVAASQILKQAAVVMLHHLVPDQLPPGSLRRDLDRYLPRTAHGSSLSFGIHAAALARCGRADEALAMLRAAARIDLDDVTGSAAGGVHLATAGSVWQAIVYGFLGLRPRPDGALTLDPHLPDAWRSVTVHVTSRGRPLQVHVTETAATVSCERPVRFVVRGQRLAARPPRTTFELPPPDRGTA